MVGRVFLGRHETVRLLGEGGMGRVYLARQLDLGRQVVVKVMHDHVAADPTFRERFQRETLLMARFQHPGRIRVRLGGKGSVYLAPKRGSLSWLGLGRKGNTIDMELRL
jgi:serine/threonine-protein kinase